MKTNRKEESSRSRADLVAPNVSVEGNSEKVIKPGDDRNAIQAIIEKNKYWFADGRERTTVRWSRPIHNEKQEGTLKAGQRERGGLEGK